MQTSIVVVIGSGGTWGRGATLDAAWEQIARVGGPGRQILVYVAPAESEASVDTMGCLCWRGDTPPRKVTPSRSGAWAARRTKALRTAIDAVMSHVAAESASRLAARLPACPYCHGDSSVERCRNCHGAGVLA